MYVGTRAYTGIGAKLYTLSNSLLHLSVYEKMWVLIRSEDVFAYVLLGMHTPTGDRARQKKEKEEERGGKKWKSKHASRFKCVGGKGGEETIS